MRSGRDVCRDHNEERIVEVLIYLVPLALGLGLAGLGAFLWSLKTGQYDDPEGAAWRAIMDDDTPIDHRRRDL
jgi:cbb3-type cytochrome oxidase maturation protein